MSESKKAVESGVQRRSLRTRKLEETKNEEKDEASDGGEGSDHEPFSEVETEDEELFGPESLGLTRVGSEPKPRKGQTLPAMNNRGRPARLRKKNPIFDNANVVTDKKQMKQPPTPKKASSSAAAATSSSASKNTSGRGRPARVKREPSSEPESTPPPPKKTPRRGGRSKKVQAEDSDEEETVQLNPVDKKQGQKVGLRLRNLLKLPKAHKFVSYEWFYSTIDKAILGGENDFQQCLKIQFPTLITRNLTRTEWNRIRSHMGKPRRCSAAFFEEERRELERRRQKIRLLQSRKAGDPSFIRDLPREIPLPLSVGMKVTARLRRPQDGLFTGTVEAIDPISNSYKIHFDRPGLGTYPIPDYEVCATDAPETLNLATITQNFRPKSDVALYMISPLRREGPHASIGGGLDPLLGNKITFKFLLNTLFYTNISFPRW